MQSMLFRIDDTGPFWMTEAERDQKRHDLVLEGQIITRQYTKDELLKQLMQRGMLAKGKKQAIQSKAQEHNLPRIEETKAKVVEGWENKPNGLLRILWERGFIDELRLENYMLNGKHDAFGFVQKDFSLKSLKGNCLDFEEEETLFYCSQWERKWEYLLTERRNVTVNLQERESSILGVAPRKFLPSGFSEEEKGKENSGLWCERACQQKKC